MKVAIVINTSWNIYNFRMGLIKALKKEGHEVVAIAPEDEFSPLLQKEVPFYPVKMQAKGSNPFSDFSLIVNFYSVYKKLKPDCILHYTIKPNIYGTLAARLLNIPCINNVSGLGTVFLHNNLVSKVAKSLYKFAFRFPHKVFFQNTDDRDLFVDLKLIKAEKTDLVPGSGVDLDYFKPSVKEGDEPFVFLLIGRLLFDKGITEYAQAASMIKARYPDVKFWLAGSFDKNKKLGIPEGVVYKWHEEKIIQYKGFAKDIRELIAKADCVVLPSYREGTPKTLLEAAAMAKPIVATDVPGCKEVVVEVENGFLTKAKDPQDLAEKMKTILNLPKRELLRMGRKSRALVENRFSEEKVFIKYTEVLNELNLKLDR